MPIPVLNDHTEAGNNNPAMEPHPSVPAPSPALSKETHPLGVYIETYGCQMNAHDTERLREVLAPYGYRSVDSERQADLIILNSCDIREKAKHKLVSQLGRLKEVKSERPGVLVAVAGCVAQVEGRKLLKIAPHLDIVVGTDQLRRIPEMVQKALAGHGPQVEIEFWNPSDGSADAAFVGAQEGHEPGSVTAFVTAMTGCDKKCAYCIVPYTRGKERSRPMASILSEVEMLVGKGVREVMLIGQTVNTYGQDFPNREPDFSTLLDNVARVPDLLRIRFMTSHPRDLSDRLIETMGRIPLVAPHLHLPVQSGSNPVLARMRRGYTREWYTERVVRLRQARPDISITSDIIVGFPGETDADFDLTMQLLDEVRFDNLFSFAFSERPGTEAERMEGRVDPEIRRARLNILQARQRGFTRQFMERQQGTVADILVEGASRLDVSVWSGKTGQNVTVNFHARDLKPGVMQKVRIDEVKSNSLFGTAVDG